jgi:hypothetical protein
VLGIDSSSTQGGRRGFTSNRPAYIATCTAGTSLPNSTSVVLPMVATYDPDGCASGNGFQVPSWGAGLYQLNYYVTINAQSQIVYAKIQVNGVDALSGPVTAFATDISYSCNGSDQLVLNAGDIVTLVASQGNTTASARTTMTVNAFQVPRLSLHRLQA